VRQWLCAKFKEQGQGKKRFSNQYLHQKLGLHRMAVPEALTRFPQSILGLLPGLG